MAVTGDILRGQHMDYSNRNLKDWDFTDAALTGANFYRANLTRAIFGRAVLTDANLEESCLQDADLSNVQGLRAGQLRGSDVTGAKLPPEIAKFEALAVAAEASKNASTIFVALLAACAYSWLTIASTTDVAFLTNTAVTQLPFIQTSIPLATFYVCAPVLLLALFLYFHFSLQFLWESLASLPARLTDGRPLHERAYPWLLNVIIRPQVVLRRPERSVFVAFQIALVRLFAWWILPLSLLLFWWEGLKRQDWFLTGLHLVLFFVAVLAVFALAQHATNTLGGIPRQGQVFRQGGLKNPTRVPTVAASLATVFLCGLSIYVFHATPQNPILDAVEKFGLPCYARLPGLSLSVPPNGWNGVETKDVLGINLASRGLRKADLTFAFLVNGSFEHADLSWAKLSGADLRGAKLEYASLFGAKLDNADLRGAHMWYGDLTGATMFNANLQGMYWRSDKSSTPGQTAEFGQLSAQQLKDSASWVLSKMSASEALGLPPQHTLKQQLRDFSGYDFTKLKVEANFFKADLRSFDLSGANLIGIDLTHANFRNAILRDAHLEKAKLWDCDLRGADLSGATGLTKEQLDEALTDSSTIGLHLTNQPRSRP